MRRVEDLFLHEYLGRPENRVNVALFSLMQQHWFREWFLEKLALPNDAIVYPPTNRSGLRPDLKVIDSDGRTLAWIEVELDSNTRQLEEYRNTYPEEVKALWGRRSHCGDLSLEELVERIERESKLDPQIAVNAQQLADLIREALECHRSSPGRSALSPEMRDHPLVAGLADLLGPRILYDLGGNERPPPGYLKANTTDTSNNRGFSLRVYSPKSKSPDKTLSIMSISGGRPRVYFPSLRKLQSYLPGCPREVEAYKSILCSMNLNIAKFDLNGRPWLELERVCDQLQQIVPCVLALANCYGCPEQEQ